MPELAGPVRAALVALAEQERAEQPELAASGRAALAARSRAAPAAR